MHLEKIENFEGLQKQNEELAPWLAYKIGGAADLFCQPANPDDVRLAVSHCRLKKIPLSLIGNGSNLLVKDGGIEGVVLYLGGEALGNYELLSNKGDKVLIRVPSSWAKAKLLDLSLTQAWAGLEFSAGIPGTLGGAVYMNAGTKWGSYKDVIKKVGLFSYEEGFIELEASKMGFAYRGHDPRVLKDRIILWIDVELTQKSSDEEIRAQVDEILSYRGGKQPLEFPNCGSVFKNPPNSERGAGRLIEACGLKGYRVGGAQVSNKHANFIVNVDSAKSQDVEAVIEHIKKTVYDRFKIELHTEVIILGRD